MAHQYSFPDEHWNWPVKLTHHHAVRAGNLIFTGGQVDLDAQGTVRNLGNLDQQCRNSMAYMSDLLNDLGADFADLVRLVVYYVGDADDEARLFDLLAEIIGHDTMPVINMIILPELCYPGMLTEIEGVAMRAPSGERLLKQHFHLPDMPHLPNTFSHVLRCGEMVFTSDLSAMSPQGAVATPDDIVAQTTLMMDRLCDVLAAAGAGMSDVVKVNTFYRGDGTADDWAKSATIRADHFPDPGPAPTGIPVPSFPHQGLMAKIAATAICAQEGEEPLTKRFSWPEGHWDWTVKLPYKHGTLCNNVIHVGGQVSLDSTANVIHPDDMVAQTRVAMDNLKRVLAEFGAKLNDVVKVTTFYQGSASAEALHENLLIRSGSYTDPGPATTGIPVPALVYENMVIEIEAIAVLN
ncbi:2-aminomuconate deaminase [Roseovarius albus]|uniref:2-aminomuconate deaminase n=1 Tax=Roseovarius albus TaxID=1247867 RepID=A0A1X7A2U7_9RHOB|nr:RidA family protein [Roseovarius albus]SLN68899.1 2-aminomuconate deaminase [Roseovarius albus]